MHRLLLIALATVVTFGAVSAVRGDDDDGSIPPPLDPFPGYEGILPAPMLPRNYFRDQHTIPYGLQSVANTPELHLGQVFRPSRSSIDWVAFILENNTQPSDPNPPGPGLLQVSLYRGINSSNGELSGLLGKTDEVSIPSDTTSWLVFHFPDSIPLTPGTPYYAHLEQTGGYQSWVGIRAADIYPNGNAFAYFYDTVFHNPPRNLNWGGRDFHFAQGVTLASGDIDQDGDVDRSDAARFSPFLGRDTGSTWTTGDFDGDDATTLADWSLLQSHIVQPTPNPSVGHAPTTVPEPVVAWLAVVVSIAFSLRAARQRARRVAPA